MTHRSVASWARAHERVLLAGLLAAGVLLRVLLAAGSPAPFGYVWDFYHEGVRVLYERGRLPVASDCWQCYHPPLFYLLGWPLYAIGRAVSAGPTDAAALRWLGVLPLVCGAATVYFGYRLLRWMRCRGGLLVLGFALLAAFPCLFISSYATEADIVVTAVLSAFVFYLARDASAAPPKELGDLLRLGALAGLAAATKYSGLVGLVSIFATLAWHVVRGTGRLGTAAGQAVIVLALCAAIAGWKYADNARWYGTPLVANGAAARGFSLADRRQAMATYEFDTFRIRDLIRTVAGEAPPGPLTTLPIYRSVPGTLHGLAWSDLSFFSEPSRHGDASRPYPRKRQWPALTVAVLLLGFVPEALAVVGVLVMLRRPRFHPLVMFSAVSLAAYVWWFLAQTDWALKTKYVLFLLPPFVLYAVVGFAWIWRRTPAVVGLAAAALLAALVLLLHAYLLVFAIG